MQVIRLRPFSLAGIRCLYNATSLGVDNFINMRNKIKDQFREVEEKFKVKMADFANEDNPSMIFTEDLKHMVHLAEGTENDMDLVHRMMLKFSNQNKEIRFGSFVFGPVVMRMYYNLEKPNEALKAFTELEKNGFFDQLISYQILMDLLLKHKMYQEVLNVFDVVRGKQLHGSKFPKNAVVLVLAACYMLNTPNSFNYAKQLWSDLNQSGSYPMRRAGTYAAALAIQQSAPDIALEILTSMKQQGYVTIKNLKVLALSDLGRPDDALPLLRAILGTDKEAEKNTICEEVVDKLSAAIEKFDRKELSLEFDRIHSQLRKSGHISSMHLSELLCSEISIQPFSEFNKTSRIPGRRRMNYQLRPGLEDMA